MSLELRNYVKEALGKGATKAAILTTLTESGWAESVIQKTLEQFSGVDAQGVPIPAPRMQAHQIAKDWFVYVLALVTLTMNAYALGALLFNLIDHAIADPAARNSWDYGTASINWAIAQLLITLPVYLKIQGVIQADIMQHPEKRESLIRKLLIYAILGITVLVGLGDAIGILNNFLSGELTLRFIAKAFVVLGLALLIFFYYLSEMRKDDSLVKRAER
jgi:hypothetical protein